MPTERIIPSSLPAPSVVLNATGVPALFILTGVERLRVLAITDDGNATYSVNGRMQTPKGDVVPFSFVGQSTNTAVLQTQDFNLGAGTLLTLTVQIVQQSGTQMWGRDWVQVQVIEGTGTGAVVLGTLVQSYVTASLPVAWPGTPFRAAVEGPGLTRTTNIFGSIPGTSTAHFTPGHPFRAQLLGFSFSYTSDAVAGSRIMEFFFQGPFGTNAWVVQSLGQAPSTTRSYFFVPGAASVDYSAINGVFVYGVPEDVFLNATDTLLIQAGNADVGDTFNNGNVVWRSWYDL